MYCRQCGKEVMENSVVCPSCGALVKSEKTGIQNMNWLILGGAVVSIIATFMPFISFWGGSISLMNEATQTEGIGIIMMSLVAGILGFFPKARKFSFIPALFNIYVVFYDISPALDRGAEAGIGAVLILLANIVIVVGAIIEFTKTRKIR